MAIRNGELERPINYGYESMYWSLRANLRDKLHPPGAKISLKEAMSELPYSEEELQKLHESEYESNKLVKLELQAFEAMEGFYEDNNGHEHLIQDNLGPKVAKSFFPQSI